MAPLGRPPLSKTLSAKVAPVKAAHPSNVQAGTASKLNFKGVVQSTIQQATPLRRYSDHQLVDSLTKCSLRAS